MSLEHENRRQFPLYAGRQVGECGNVDQFLEDQLQLLRCPFVRTAN